MKSPNEAIEKISSAHRAVNQMEDQVEVTLMARCRPSIFVIAYLKAALGAGYSARVGTKMTGNLLPTRIFDFGFSLVFP